MPTTYETNDGQRFEFESDAQKHANKIAQNHEELVSINKGHRASMFENYNQMVRDFNAGNWKKVLDKDVFEDKQRTFYRYSNVLPDDAFEQAKTMLSIARTKIVGSYKGRLSLEYDAVYEGDIVEGKPHGKGKYTLRGGEFYEGDFVDGKWHGRGKYTEKSYVYEGSFTNTYKSGRGRITFQNGDVFEGDFDPEKNEGEGTMTYANGKVKKGKWTCWNDKFKGKGLFG